MSKTLLVLILIACCSQIACAGTIKKTWMEEGIHAAVVRGWVGHMYDHEDEFRLRQTKEGAQSHIYISIGYRKDSDPSEAVMKQLHDPVVVFQKGSEAIVRPNIRERITNSPGMILEINRIAEKHRNLFEVNTTNFYTMDCKLNVRFSVRYKNKKYFAETIKRIAFDCPVPIGVP